MKIEPYLFFNGRCEEAIAFYRDTFGAEVAMLMRYRESPEAPQFQGFSLSVAMQDADSAKGVFDALADGGQVQMPLGKTFFSPCFGMVTDRFGVGWMVIVPA